jgi:hypothetical protein
MAYSSIVKPTDYFNTKLYTGNGGTNAITGVGFQPDWVWVKDRGRAGYNHIANDSVRGVTKYLRPNLNNDEDTYTNAITSFDSDGFTLGSDASNGEHNISSQTYVAWNWKAGGSASSNTDGSVTSNVSANTTSGFSICTFTATGSSMTFGHGLGVAPNLVIWKRRDSNTNGDWATSSDPQGWTNYMTLNNTTANQSGSSRFGSAPTSSVVTVGSETVSSGTYVAYCFASIKGYSKIGSYTGNGNADGTFVYTGFKPAFVIVKVASGTTGNWQIQDSKRDGFNENKRILANVNEAEKTSQMWDQLSNGFKIRVTSGDANGSGNSYIYMAFAESPFVANDSGTAVPVVAR